MRTLLNYLIIISFLACNIGNVAAQQGSGDTMPIDEETKLISYQEVIRESGKKDELYIRAIGWINNTFKNPTSVTRVRDRENGKIKGISRFRIKYTDKDGNNLNASIIEYTFILEFKEGRYRFTFTELTIKQTSRIPVEKWLNKQDQAYNPKWDDYLVQIDTYIKEKIASLKKEMKPPVKKDDNW